MDLAGQFRAIGEAIAAPARVRRRTGTWLAVFALVAIAIVLLVARGVYAARDELVDVVLEYVLPARWRALGHALLDMLWSQRIEAVLTNAVLSVSLFLLSTLLLPLRERVSVVFAAEARLVDEAPSGTPLVHLVIDVVVTLAVLVVAQLTVFVIGWSRDPGRRALASALSYLVLCGSCTMDLVPPVMLRHGVRTSGALAALKRRPLLAVAFGSLFVAPGLLAVHLSASAAPATRMVAIVGANLVGVLWGTLGGTVVGARLLADGRALREPSRLARALAWTLLLGALAWYAYALGASGLALDHKSQLLKCRFHVVPSSISVDVPRLGGLLFGHASTKVRATLEIENPTDHELAFERSRFEVQRGGALVARVELNPGAVPAHQTARYPIEAPIVINPRELEHALARAAGWDVTLYVQAAPGVEIPIYIKDAR
jgi:hypothetical protein